MNPIGEVILISTHKTCKVQGAKYGNLSQTIAKFIIWAQFHNQSLS